MEEKYLGLCTAAKQGTGASGSQENIWDHWEANKEFLLTGCCCFTSAWFFLVFLIRIRLWEDGVVSGPFISRLAQSSGLIF